MKTVKKTRVVNPTTGKSYWIYERHAEPGDKPIRGLWAIKKKKEK